MTKIVPPAVIGMSQRTSHAHGTRNRVSLQTTVQHGAKSLYDRLFGCRFDHKPMPRGGVFSVIAPTAPAP
jgi:hypothetical protein